MRRRWEPAVAGGGVNCSRCQEPIEPGTPWDLGHSADRTRWTGPEHRACNRATITHNGAARKLEYLEPRVPSGLVRCGVCGWVIAKGAAWTIGHNGPQHEVCEFDVCPGGPPTGTDGPRIWSHDWGRTSFGDD